MLRESGSEKAFIVVVGAKRTRKTALFPLIVAYPRFFGLVDAVTADPSSRQVSTADARAYAKEIEAEFAETSAKANVNVVRVFDLIGKHYYPDLEPTVAESAAPPLGKDSPSALRSPALALSNDKKQFQVFVDSKPHQQNNGDSCTC